MAFQTGTTGISSIENLIQTLSTFLTGLTGPAWVEDELDTGNDRATFHSGTLFVSFRWGDTPDEYMGVYQSTGFTAATAPHSQPGDSGNGSTSQAGLSTTTFRSVDFNGAGPFTRYYFYASETAPFYCHVVVESSGGVYQHFGFGFIDKFGTWTGGEYVYGGRWDQGTADIDNPKSNDHALGFDFVNSGSTRGATMRAPNFDGLDGSQVWLNDVNNVVSPGNDRAGNPRYMMTGSGWRGGGLAWVLGWLRASTLSGFKPLQAIEVFCMVNDTPDDSAYYLGTQPDVRSINIGNLNPADEITIGGDTWQVFPTKRKQFLQINTEESWNQGIAFKKIL